MIIAAFLLSLQQTDDGRRPGVAPPAYDQLLKEGKPELGPEQADSPDTASALPHDDHRDRPSKDKIKATAHNVERVGDLYERLGHCTGSMTPEEVQETLAVARQQGPAADYLTARFAKGFRSPRNDKWCGKEVASAARAIAK